MTKLNRLWIRISVVFTLVVIGSIMIPLTVGLLMNPSFELGTNQTFLKEHQAAVGGNVQETMGEVSGRVILTGIARLLTFVTMLGIIAGVISSRSLTAPLTRLADAAKAIGQRDLSQRVEVGGSQEIQEVARAFNEMASQLEQAEVMRQNLLADVAHELRTPLTVIQGNLRAILDDVYELNTAEISRLYDQTRQLSNLVDDLRELAQAEADQLPLEMHPLDPNLLVEDIAKMYQPAADADGITLHTTLQSDLSEIRGDRGRLTQSLQNILNNAFRHTPKGGTVSITTSKEGDFLKITVSDTGNGIDAEHLPRVFDRFYRADPARTRHTGGSGLGLAITKAILNAHGGDINAQSAGIGKGAEFVITLPL